MTIINISSVESRKYNPDFLIRFFVLQVMMATTTAIHQGIMLMLGQMNLPTQVTKVLMNSEVLSNDK